MLTTSVHLRTTYEQFPVSHSVPYVTILYDDIQIRIDGQPSSSIPIGFISDRFLIETKLCRNLKTNTSLL